MRGPRTRVVTLNRRIERLLITKGSILITVPSAPPPVSGPEGAAATKAWVHNPSGKNEGNFLVLSLLPDTFDIVGLKTLPPCMLVGMEGADASSVLGDACVSTDGC